jgi:two-component system, OmpR family, alkaline phosphatase synthesis response regulator PhoP
VKPRILLVEDETAFAIPMVDRLEAEGYSAELASNGVDGLARARRGPYDLILLDVMLPGRNGLDVCRDLRNAGVRTPILMLTARGEISDRVVGLKLGADDYLVKPFAVAELLARIEALLRRAGGREVGAGMFQIGDVRVDLERNEVARGEERIVLSRAELRLLRYLLERPGFVVSREELLERVWGMEGDMLTRTVDVHMGTLRKKLEPDARYPKYLLTIKGLGYKIDL